MTANTANVTKHISQNVSSQRSHYKNTANRKAPTAALVRRSRSQLAWLIEQFDYRAVANSIVRSSGWCHHLLHGGRCKITTTDVIAINAAYTSAQGVYRRSRKAWELLSRITQNQVDTLHIIEELGNLI